MLLPATESAPGYHGHVLLGWRVPQTIRSHHDQELRTGGFRSRQDGSSVREGE